MGSITTKLLSETLAVPAVSVRPGGLSAISALVPAYAVPAVADARQGWDGKARGEQFDATSDVRPSATAICKRQQRGNGMAMSPAGFGTHGYPSWRDWI